jgi:CheY-like chemotaxis protein
MKILIVDGSRVMRRIVMRTLRQAGLVGQELLEAGDGYEALRAVSEHAPDLVLSDWDLAGMDGLTLLGAVRAGGDEVPFGLFAASSSPAMVSRAETAGALFVIPKPFTPEAVREGLGLAVPGVSDGDRPATRAEQGTAADPLSALPTPKAVRDLFVGLLGRDVEVAVTDPYAPEDGRPATLAVYVDDALRARAVVVTDLPMSAYSGAAVGLVPAGVAEDSIFQGELGELLRENLSEVLNVCASLLNAEGLPHLRLHAVYPAGATAPSDVVAFAGVLGQRLDLRTTISGYGVGRFSVVCLG